MYILNIKYTIISFNRNFTQMMRAIRLPLRVPAVYSFRQVYRKCFDSVSSGAFPILKPGVIAKERANLLKD